MHTAFTLLRLLNDGQFHSGTDLALQLKVSRSTIWKAIDYLRQRGLHIHAVQGRGYRWYEPLELWDKAQISAGLTSKAKSFFSHIETFYVIPSTNDYLLQRLSHHIQPGTVCLAEGQTAGRGRMGKTWVSPIGANIYASFYYCHEGSLQSLNGLSLVIGLGILEGLKSLGNLPPNLGVKWPNDIWHGTHKLAGILIETSPHPRHTSLKPLTDAIIGMGINVAMKTDPSLQCDWTDLSQVFGETPSRNVVLIAIFNALAPMLRQFQQHGLSPFLPLWQQHDVLVNKQVTISQPNSIKRGIARGINERGELCVQVDEGMIAVRSGEVNKLSHC